MALHNSISSKSIEINIREIPCHLTEVENNLEKWKENARNEMLTKLIQQQGCEETKTKTNTE